MSLPLETQVLVVGAGPVGLAAAITLTQLGVEVTLVDAGSTTHVGGRAAVVHSRTLEVLDTIGLAEPLIKLGTPVPQVSVRGKTQTLFHVDFSLLKEENAKFLFMLLISQEVIEKFFVDQLERLGKGVHYNKKAVNVQSIGDSNRARVEFEDGTSINAGYIIGADGIHSIVRKSAHINFINPFTNQSYDDPTMTPAFNLILTDLYLKEPFCENVPTTAFSVYVDNFFFFIPLRTVNDGDSKDINGTPSKKTFWRVGFGFPNTVELPKRPTQEQIQQLLDERNPWKSSPIIIDSVISSSRYRIRVAQAEKYHSKIGNVNILLAGDAAHMHSPVGGQGMNLGICDAVAAAQAIYAHIHSGMDKNDGVVFDDYSRRRHTVGRRVIKATRAFTAIVNTNYGWRRIVRNILFRVLNQFRFARHAFVRRLSGIVNRDG